MATIIKMKGSYFVSDTERGMTELYPCTRKGIKIGDEVFWIDPSYLRGDEHASKWAKITDIRGEIIELDNGTEVTIDELYW